MIRSTASRARRAALQRRWLSTAPEHGKAHARSAGLASASRRVSDVKSEKLADAATNVTYTLPHPIYSDQYVDGVELTHKEPEKFVDTLAMRTIQLMVRPPPPAAPPRTGRPRRPLTPVPTRNAALQL